MNIKRVFSTFLKGYKPYDYWYERGKVYQKEFDSSKAKFAARQEKLLIDYLNSLSFETIMEFGCGFGRITKLMLENFPIKKYTAIDLSPHQIHNAKKLCKNFKNVNFVQTTIQKYKSDDKFDLVLRIEVLEHVIPDDINSVINKLVSLARHHLIHIDFNTNYHPKIHSPHTFLYQYEKIYKKENMVYEMIEQPLNGQQSLFHAKIA